VDASRGGIRKCQGESSSECGECDGRKHRDVGELDSLESVK
jgi:hypothetical protein